MIRIHASRVATHQTARTDVDLLYVQFTPQGLDMMEHDAAQAQR
jgi:hypothetical protein